MPYTPAQQASQNPKERVMPMASAQASGAIQLPPGKEVQSLLGMAKRMNDEFGTYWKKNHEIRLTDTQRILLGMPAQGSRPGATVIPLAQSIQQTSQARMKTAIKNKPKSIEAAARFTPLTPPPTEDQRIAYESWMNQEIDQMPAQKTFLDDLLYNGLSEGVGVAEISWRVDKEEQMVQVMVPSVDPQTGLPAQMSVPDPATGKPMMQPQTWERGHAEAEAVSLWSLAWDPREKVSFMSASWVRRRRMVSANDMLQLQQAGVIDGAQEAIDGADRETNGTDNFGADSQSGSGDPDAKRAYLVKGLPLPVINYDEGIYRLDEWWATITYKDPETGEHQQGTYNFWVCADEFLLKCRPSPYGDLKPFATFPILRQPSSVVGQSIIDLIKPALAELETTSASHKKVKRRIADTPTLNGIGSGMNVRSKLLEENSILNVVDVNQVKLAPIPVEVIKVLEDSMGYLSAEIRQGTPANDQSQGIQQEGVDTATEAQILASGSSSRFDWLVGAACEQFFPECAKLIQAMCKEYAEPTDLDYTESRGEGDVKMLDPSLLNIPWDYKAASPVEEAWKRQRLQSIQGALGQLIPLYAQNPGLFRDAKGQQYELDFMGLLRDQLLPLMGLSEKGFLRPAQAMPMMPGQPGMPPPGSGGPPPAAPPPGPTPELPPPGAA
jgi:hypothetical protein